MKIIIFTIIAGIMLTGCSQSKDSPEVATAPPTVISVIDNRADVQGGLQINVQNVIRQESDNNASNDTASVPGNEETTSAAADTATDDETAGQEVNETGEPDAAPDEVLSAVIPAYEAGDSLDVGLNPSWLYADHAAIASGTARLYRAGGNRKNVIIGVNAGHGTRGGQSVKTLCHPDGSPKLTGGTTASGSVKAAAVSGGMTFADGTSEAAVTLRCAQLFRDALLAKGYDVLMLRDGDDVQLDNVARTIIANNAANCLISLHWDGDGLAYDKGCFYISVPEGLKAMEPVASHWQQHESLGQALIGGLSAAGCKINGKGSMAIDLTQTSYSTIPSVDIELGNAASAHDDATLSKLAAGMADGVSRLF